MGLLSKYLSETHRRGDLQCTVVFHERKLRQILPDSVLHLGPLQVEYAPKLVYSIVR
jgi:hypothetical protein